MSSPTFLSSSTIPSGPVTMVRPSRRLSIPAAEYAQRVADGAVAVDIRTQELRDRDGVVFGALAIPAELVVARLSPGGDCALRCAGVDTEWLIVGQDGHDADWLAWHAQAAGAHGARSVAGGYRALRDVPVAGGHILRDFVTFSAH